MAGGAAVRDHAEIDGLSVDVLQCGDEGVTDAFWRC